MWLRISRCKWCAIIKLDFTSCCFSIWNLRDSKWFYIWFLRQSNKKKRFDAIQCSRWPLIINSLKMMHASDLITLYIYTIEETAENNTRRCFLRVCQEYVEWSVVYVCVCLSDMFLLHWNNNILSFIFEIDCRRKISLIPTVDIDTAIANNTHLLPSFVYLKREE